jgi:hypothetical protein
LEGLIFEPPDRLIRPRSANAPATVVYIDIRFLASSVDSWLEEVRAGQERANLQVAESRFNEPRWLLEWALAWIAFRTKEALLLSYIQLNIRLHAASRGYGNPDGIVTKDPAVELLNADSDEAGHAFQ